jgi:PPOX class probable F420-dependent enzyme
MNQVVREFLTGTNRCVLMTRRRDGGIQSSPMSVVADDSGNVLFSTRHTAAKVKNLKRDPYAAACLITERFLGGWLHVEGTAEIEFLPDALPALADFYRRRTGEDTSTEAFKERMEQEGRCLIRLRPTRVVQPPPRPARMADSTPLERAGFTTVADQCAALSDRPRRHFDTNDRGPGGARHNPAQHRRRRP